MRRLIDRVLRKIVEMITNQKTPPSGDIYIKHLRGKGIKIGERCYMQPDCEIDESRPSLVTIGTHCFFSKGFTLLTHDYTSWMFRELYHDFLPSSGKVTIGNNVYFGRYCTVLKGVTIGDNCIIGLGSVITKDIPAGSVAVGVPAKTVCTVDEYYNKRKKECVEEAHEYARSIKERFARRPESYDFYEEFPLYMSGKECSECNEITAEEYPNFLQNKSNYINKYPVHFQIREGYDEFILNHKSIYNGLDEFLKAAGIE